MLYFCSYGCSILSDGWTDTRRRSVVNILVSCPLGTVFLRGVDATRAGGAITAEFIYEAVISVVQEIGAEHVVQVVTDNGSNCRSMGEMVMREHPSIVWTPCAAHCIDLLIQDMVALPWIREVQFSSLCKAFCTCQLFQAPNLF